MQLISVLIMLSGLLIPVLAAAPFYVLDSREERRALEEAAGRASSAGTAASDADAVEVPAEDGAEQVDVVGTAAEVRGDTASPEAAGANAFEDATVRLLPFPSQRTADSVEEGTPVQEAPDRGAAARCDAA